ncbi:MAG: transglutaminase domain-containing protein, partial [Candidatus Levybacteria bacterium]|nr:transglutaminase domain-containing protein [Candidatus Levybacteria bacterium]
KKENIEVTGYASVVANPKGSIVSNELLKKYLKNERYWESESPKIKDLALKLKTPSEIYDYVVNNLTYDYDRVTKDQSRAGAESVLTDPTSAVCLEFTDLFIALSRSAGIPARELNGYGYTRDENYRPLSKVSDVLHSWPQYYDLGKQSWVMVDPTWGNTTGGIDYYHTFDFNHLTLAIHGVKSNYPVPAGGYKLSAKDETLKDVIVTPVKVITLKKSNATKISFKFPSKINSGISSKGEIIVENTGNYASDPQSILLETENLSPKRSQFRIGRIPPFGKNTIPIVVSSSNFLTKGEDNIKITSQSQTFIQNVEVILFFFNIYFIIGGTLVVIAIIIISIIAYKSRSIYLPQQ